MNIKEVFTVINQMQADGVIESYALGGAVGAAFYLEPTSTLDVDIFVALETQQGSLLLSLDPIIEYLEARGGVMENAYVVFADTPVQFLAPGTGLDEEALRAAVDKDIDGIRVRVFTAEHLAAIALQTGRAKDKTRLVQFIDEGALDIERFQQILERHGLVEKWEKFERRFLAD